MSIYDHSGKLAKRLISKRGSLGTLTRTTSTLDPVSQVTTKSVQTAQLPTVLINVARVRAQKFEAASLVQSTSTGFLISTYNQPMVPQVGDTLTVNGVIYKLVWVSPENPTGGNNPLMVTAFGNK